MAKKRTNPPAPTREQQRAEAAVGTTDAAPPTPVQDAPSTILNKSSTYYDELRTLGAQTLDLVDLTDIEKRIGLLSRVILEHYLRVGNLSPKDRCDVALRAITTLEGSKQEISWRDELLRKPRKITAEAYTRERKQVEERLKKILLRKQEVKVAVAEEALKQLGEPEDEDVN